MIKFNQLLQLIILFGFIIFIGCLIGSGAY